MSVARLEGMRWEWIYQLGFGALVVLVVGASAYVTLTGGTVDGAGLGVVFVAALLAGMGLLRWHSSRLVLEASPQHAQIRSMVRTQQVALDRLRSAQLKPDEPATPGGWGVGPTWAVLELEDDAGGRIGLEMPLQVGPKTAVAEQAQVWQWVQDGLDASWVEVSEGLAASLAMFTGRDGSGAAGVSVPADVRASGRSQAAGMGYASLLLAASGFLISYLGFMATLVGTFGVIQGVRLKAPWWTLALNGVGIVAGIWVRAATM